MTWGTQNLTTIRTKVDVMTVSKIWAKLGNIGMDAGSAGALILNGGRNMALGRNRLGPW